jgi:hypothetical protein
VDTTQRGNVGTGSDGGVQQMPAPSGGVPTCVWVAIGVVVLVGLGAWAWSRQREPTPQGG